MTVDPDAPPEVKEVMPSFQYTGYNDEAIGNHSPTREGSPITRDDWQEDWSVAESISPSEPGLASGNEQGGHHALAHAGVATAPDTMQQGHHALAHAGMATAPDMLQQGGHHALAHAGVAMAPDMMQPGG